MAASKTSRKSSRAPLEPTPRHVWLAGLGLIAIARRQAIAAVTDATARLQAARAGEKPAAKRTRVAPVRKPAAKRAGTRA